MKYKAGDKVRIRSKEWYESHKNKFGKIWTVSLSGEGSVCFDQDNAKYCGKEVTIFSVESDNYVLRGIPYEWTDEMIEGLVEEKVGLVDNLSSRWVNEFELPDGYIFKDEDGNVINATKIVLEKKKKEYPKTYKECCEVMGVNHTNDLDICEHCDYKIEITYYEDSLLEKIEALYRLRICRDAYWKIAGEEMGLGKPWEPDWNIRGYYAIARSYGNVIKTSNYNCDLTFVFPTEEMRDAFYENFKELIESVKELL